MSPAAFARAVPESFGSGAGENFMRRLLFLLYKGMIFISMNFRDLNLIPPILRAAREIGYETPSPIQQKAIPPVLAGRDLLGCAQTGTGKTAAFAMPILQRLYEASAPRAGAPGGAGGANANGTAFGGAGTRGTRPIRALVLTPTRELALQIDESFADYGRYLPLAHCVIFGGVSQNPQVENLKRGVDILTATPGRLNDLIGQGYIDLGRIEIFVLDEADRMLDMGFVHDVKRVIAHLPQKKQTLLFSATMPREIEDLADSLLRSPEKVMITPPATTVESIAQSVYFVDKGNKRHLLAKLLQNPDVISALVFTRTKHGADRVVRELARAGIGAMAIHGNKSQNARQNALGSFKEGRIRVLVATDIAARGIDITGLSHVFNYDLPNIPETYVHRIGRTGRAGCAGAAISFCDFEEQEYLADIEKLTRIHIPPVEHEWPMQIFEKPEKQPPQARRQPAQRPNAPAQPAGGAQRRSQAQARRQPMPGAWPARRPGTHAQYRTAAQAPGSPQEEMALSLQKGDVPMEYQNNAPQRAADDRRAEKASAANVPAAELLAANAAQTVPGKKRRRRGGRRKGAPNADPARAAAQQAGLQAAQQAPAGQPRRPKTENNTPSARGRQGECGKPPKQPLPENRAARDQRQNGASRAQAAGPEPSVERDDSLQVIARRTPAQKYASFEDYIKAHE